MKIALAFIIASFAVAFGFQNCAQAPFHAITEGVQDLNSMHGGASVVCEGDVCHAIDPKIKKARYLTELGNADYVASVFRDIFVSRQNNDPAEAIIRNNILMNRIFFGGRCSYYDNKEDCYSDPNYNTDAIKKETQAYNALAQQGSGNSSREAHRIKTCDLLIKNDNILAGSLQKLGLSTSSILSNDNILKTYQVFYPNLFEEEPIQKLVEISSEFEGSNKDKWAKVFIVLCYSSGWQYY